MKWMLVTVNLLFLFPPKIRSSCVRIPIFVKLDCNVRCMHQISTMLVVHINGVQFIA